MDIIIPFGFDEAGRLITTTDVVEDYANRIKSVLGTNLGERVMRPGFGSDLLHNQFDFTGQDTRTTRAKHAAHAALRKQIPELDLEVRTEQIDNGSGIPGLRLAVDFKTDLNEVGDTSVVVDIGELNG